MNKANFKSLAISFLVGAVLAGGVSLLLLGGSDGKPSILGAITVPSTSTTTYGTAMQDSLLFQWQSNAVAGLNSIKNEFNDRTYSVAWNPGAISSSTPATTTVTTAGAVKGDFCLASLTTASTSASTLGLKTACEIDPDGTAFVSMVAIGNNSLTVNPDAGTLFVRVFKSATSSVNIHLATTSTPYNN